MCTSQQCCPNSWHLTSLFLLPQSQSEEAPRQHFSSAGTEMTPEWSFVSPAIQKQTPVFSYCNPQIGETAWWREKHNNQTEDHLCEGVTSGTVRGLQQGLCLAEPIANHSPSSTTVSYCLFSTAWRGANTSRYFQSHDWQLAIVTWGAVTPLGISQSDYF